MGIAIGKDPFNQGVRFSPFFSGGSGLKGAKDILDLPEFRNGVAVFKFKQKLNLFETNIDLGDVKDFILKRSAGFNKVAIDLENVNVTGSGGVGVLEGINKAVQNKPGKMVVFNANASVREVLSISRMDTLFEVQGGDEGTITWRDIQRPGSKT